MGNHRYQRKLTQVEQKRLWREDGYVDVQGALALFQNIGMEHDQKVGEKLDVHERWMVYSWKVDVDQEVVTGLEPNLLLETEIIHATRLYILRRFRIFSDHKVYVLAFGQYVLTDIRKRRLVPLPEHMILPYQNSAIDVEKLLPNKVKVKDHMTLHSTLKKHVDDNGHIGNYYYVSMLQECLPLSRPITHLELTYSKELHFPQSFFLAKREGDNIVFTIWDEEKRRIHTSGYVSSLTE